MFAVVSSSCDSAGVCSSASSSSGALSSTSLFVWFALVASSAISSSKVCFAGASSKSESAINARAAGLECKSGAAPGLVLGAFLSQMRALTVAHSLETRLKAAATVKARALECERSWNADEIAQLGTLDDGELARQLGKTRSAVAAARRRAGVASVHPCANLSGPDSLLVDGDALKARRIALGLSQSELGARLAWGRSRVSHLESGHVARAHCATLDKIAAALGCEVAAFLLENARDD